MKTLVKNFFRGISNIWRWLPIVWRDRQWDYLFLCEMLAHKLELMQEYFESDRALHSDAHELAQQMKDCAERARRIADDNYLSDARKELNHGRWGDSDWILNPTNEGHLRWHGMWYENAETYEENDLANDEFLTACVRSCNMLEKDKDFLFFSMREWIDGWWD